MASKKRANRIADRSRQWRAALACVFVASLVAAIVASPFTNPFRIRVSGVPRHEEVRVTRILSSISQTPCMLTDTGAVENRLADSPEVRSAAVRANVFGRVRVSVDYRVPVAMLDSKKAIDEAGIVFEIGSRKPSNLQISMKVEDFSSILTISDSSPLNRLARVAKKIQVFLPKLVGTLEFDDKERISLRIEGLVVEFGDTSNLDEKVNVLARTLLQDPQRVSEGGRIILVDPENPVQVR